MLTDIKLRSIPFEESGQRDYVDSPHLFVRVGKKAKTFVAVTASNGHRKRQAIGHYPSMGLAAARARAKDLMAEARLKPEEPETLKFGEALALFETIQLPTMRARSQYECRRVLRRYFDPLSRKPLTELKTPAISTILDRITSADKRNAYVWLRLFLNWCYRRGYMDHNPLSRLAGLGASNSRDRVLTDAEIKSVWQTASEAHFGRYGAYIRLLLLTGQRKNQWLQFRPEFIDLENRLVIWPAAIMKSNRTHAIPLTDLMLRILAEHHEFGHWAEDYNTKRIMAASGTTGWHRHDLRRTCATKMSELGVAPHVVERLLAHTIPGVAGRYNRHHYFSEMHAALETWGAWLAREAGNYTDYAASSKAVET